MRSFLSITSLFLLACGDSVSANDVVHFQTPKDFNVVTLMDLTDQVGTDGNLEHYGPPPDCDDDEQALQIAGVPGKVCVPKCDALGQCPSDVPDGKFD